MTMPPKAIPEITVQQLAEKLASGDDFVLLDVREAEEIKLARIDDRRLQLLPMSQLARARLEALPVAARARDAEIFVFCHHGSRSAQVATWLTSQGWTNCFSVAGGIDEYARLIDSSVGSY